MSYTGWLLPAHDRAELLRRFPPVYHDVIAHHVTLAMGVHELPEATSGTVVGMVDDGYGVQALVVVIDGTTERWDGFTYHITLSIDRETCARKPHHSLAVLKEYGWEPVWPVSITLVPMVFPDS
jgi:hypothetical protein